MTQNIVIDVMSNKFPCEGPRIVELPLDFSAASSYSVNLNTLVQQGKISEVQALFIDNADNTSALTLVIGITNQRVIIPPGSQAYLMLLMGTPTLVASTTNFAKAKIFALNFPVSNMVWAAGAAGTGANVTVTNFPATQPTVYATPGQAAMSASQPVTLANDQNYSAMGFKVATTGTVTCTTASAGATIAASATQIIRVVNTGSETGYVRVGTGAQVAVLTDTAIPPNTTMFFSGAATGIAVIAATTGTTIQYSIGTGATQ